MRFHLQTLKTWSVNYLYLFMVAMLFSMSTSVVQAMTPSEAYRVLGINEGASEDEIRSAYRRKAMANHPDHNIGDRDAEDRIKEINNAYDLLYRDKPRTESTAQSRQQEPRSQSPNMSLEDGLQENDNYLIFLYQVNHLMRLSIAKEIAEVNADPHFSVTAKITACLLPFSLFADLATCLIDPAFFFLGFPVTMTNAGAYWVTQQVAESNLDKLGRLWANLVHQVRAEDRLWANLIVADSILLSPTENSARIERYPVLRLKIYLKATARSGDVPTGLLVRYLQGKVPHPLKQHLEDSFVINEEVWTQATQAIIQDKRLPLRLRDQAIAFFLNGGDRLQNTSAARRNRFQTACSYLSCMCEAVLGRRD